MENKLTLAHLAPYLPYGVKIIRSSHYRGNTIIVEWGIRNCSDYPVVGYYEGNPHGIMLSEVKPILRPLSDLTVEFFKENIDNDIVDFLINCEPEHDHFSVEVCDKVIGWTAISYEEYQLFFKNHFDVFGLIEKGLAVYINTIENA